MARVFGLNVYEKDYFESLVLYCPTGAGVLSLGDNYVLRVEPSGIVRFFYYNYSIAGADPKLGPWVDAGTVHKVNDKNWHWVAGILAGDSELSPLNRTDYAALFNSNSTGLQ